MSRYGSLIKINFSALVLVPNLRIEREGWGSGKFGSLLEIGSFKEWILQPKFEEMYFSKVALQYKKDFRY